MKRMAFFLFFSLCAYGQTSATGPAKTTGPCSPAVPGSHNTFNIRCSGVDSAQISELHKVLNKILANQIDTNAVMTKLNEILATTRETAARSRPRTIDASTKAALIFEWAQLPAKIVVISEPMGAPESYQFAERVLAVLKDAKWQAEGIVEQTTYPPRSDIFICVHGESEASLRSATLLADSFVRMGHKVKGAKGCRAQDPKRMPDNLLSDPDAIELSIGPRS